MKESLNNRDRKANRLIHEKSPYLLQHAYNPVTWFPWGDEAFEKAKQENKPIFLSIGYSTCHWCHVMEQESFEDEEVAALLNRDFISIKVDREERPDVDHIYMTVCQGMTGQGGWPLTVVMTPERKPFFAGTYYPKDEKWGRPGLLQILPHLAQLWTQEREHVEQVSKQVVEAIQSRPKQTKESPLSPQTLDQAFRELSEGFDSVYGGFGSEPKFPIPHNLLFLLRYWKSSGNEEALHMVQTTLKAMRDGGIYDHIGHGFSRYSTDEMWLVPHFEKMLYDNALLAYTYLEAYQAVKEVRFAEVARDIFAYVKRVMTSSEGAFYSAEDADSEGEEGRFYVWSLQEVQEILGKNSAQIFCEAYHITQEGNFEGKNIPNRIHTLFHSIAARYGLSEEALRQELEESRQRLFAVRENRVHPHKDDKILTAWNGLMIAAFAKGAKVLQDPSLAQVAAKSVDFILRNLQKEGRLLARFRDGEAAFPAYADDYAFLIWGLIELYEATFEASYLEEAFHLQQEMKRLFWDTGSGGFYFYGVDAEPLITRPKEIYDGALPSGNAVAALNLLRLSKMGGRGEWAEMATKLLEAFSREIGRHPSAYTFSLIALLFAIGPTKEVVIAGEREDPQAQAMLHAVHTRYLPHVVMLFHPSGPSGAAARRLSPFIVGQTALGEKPTAYVCENFSCQAPATDLHQLLLLLNA